jgi:hypothetical protein
VFSHQPQLVKRNPNQAHEQWPTDTAEYPVLRTAAALSPRANSAQIAGYLEWFGNRAWSGVTFAALTCRRRVGGRVAVIVVGRSFAGVLGALKAELAGDLLA